MVDGSDGVKWAARARDALRPGLNASVLFRLLLAWTVQRADACACASALPSRWSAHTPAMSCLCLCSAAWAPPRVVRARLSSPSGRRPSSPSTRWACTRTCCVVSTPMVSLCRLLQLIPQGCTQAAVGAAAAWSVALAGGLQRPAAAQAGRNNSSSVSTCHSSRLSCKLLAAAQPPGPIHSAGSREQVNSSVSASASHSQCSCGEGQAAAQAAAMTLCRAAEHCKGHAFACIRACMLESYVSKACNVRGLCAATAATACTGNYNRAPASEDAAASAYNIAKEQ